jgi:HK97 gp10 family phage protein
MAVKMEGWRELDKALGELPKATGRNAIKRALKTAGQPVLAEMRARAPVASGPYYAGKGDKRRLLQPGRKRDSLEISFTLNPVNRREQRNERKSFAEIHIGTRRGSTAHFFEYGTYKQPAQPYLAPAWAAKQDDALRILGQQLKVEIEKAAARYAKKMAKG